MDTEIKKRELKKINSRKMTVVISTAFAVFVIMGIAGIFHYLYPPLSFFASLRASFGMLYTAFLPGYVFVYTFLDRSKLDWVEVLALSFGMSMVIIIFTFLVANQLFHSPLTPSSSMMFLFIVMLFMIAFKLGKGRLRYYSTKIKPNQKVFK
ncbi:hypothetical protein HY605_04540 [Candidatus Peregrinibacteria bacterium]|nr:hypothetical protein [Candidatus Peregrinibacteria bacterium]